MKTQWLVYYYYYYYYWLTNCAHLTVSLKSWLLYRFSPAWGDSGISPEWTPKISLNTKIAISWKAYVFCIKKCLLNGCKLNVTFFLSYICLLNALLVFICALEWPLFHAVFFPMQTVYSILFINCLEEVEDF